MPQLIVYKNSDGHKRSGVLDERNGHVYGEPEPCGYNGGKKNKYYIPFFDLRKENVYFTKESAYETFIKVLTSYNQPVGDWKQLKEDNPTVITGRK